MRTGVSVALETNILAYAEGVNGRARKAAALELLERLPSQATLVPVQALGELVRRARAEGETLAPRSIGLSHRSCPSRASARQRDDEP